MGLESSGGILFAAVIHQAVRPAIFSHRFFHQARGVSPHLWKFFHNLRIRLRAFLLGFIRHIERRKGAQDREQRRENQKNLGTNLTCSRRVLVRAKLA